MYLFVAIVADQNRDYLHGVPMRQISVANRELIFLAAFANHDNCLIGGRLATGLTSFSFAWRCALRSSAQRAFRAELVLIVIPGFGLIQESQ